MSMPGDVFRSVLEKAVKYSMTPDDVAELYNNIVNNVQWDNDCPLTVDDVITYVNHEINNKYSSFDKQAIIDWVNKYK